MEYLQVIVSPSQFISASAAADKNIATESAQRSSESMPSLLTRLFWIGAGATIQMHSSRAHYHIVENNRIL